jgi:hypothetical protein
MLANRMLREIMEPSRVDEQETAADFIPSSFMIGTPHHTL